MASKDQIKLIFYSTAITIKIIKPSATQRLVFFIFFSTNCLITLFLSIRFATIRGT